MDASESKSCKYDTTLTLANLESSQTELSNLQPLFPEPPFCYCDVPKIIGLTRRCQSFAGILFISFRARDTTLAPPGLDDRVCNDSSIGRFSRPFSNRRFLWPTTAAEARIA